MMRLLDRYIMKAILQSTALVLLILSGLQLFVLLVSQLEAMGKGDYQMGAVFAFVLLNLPYQIYLFFPMVCLMGTLMGLGDLANHRELLVMRAAGLSIGQISWAVFKAAMVLILLFGFFGEVYFPRWVKMAADEKFQAQSGGQTMRTLQGVWLRYQDDFIFIGLVEHPMLLKDVHQFHFNSAYQLIWARHIDELSFNKGHWSAFSVAETWFDEKQIKNDFKQELVWELNLSPNIIGYGDNQPDEMTLLQIHHYLQSKSNSHQSLTHYQLVFWQRLMQPLTTAVMMILAIPFVFGSLRETTMGFKIVKGALFAFGFYILNRFFGTMTEVVQLSPFIAAITPTLIFGLMGLFLMRRAI